MTEETSSNNNSPNKEEWERTFNLFKLEYEQAAQRYENIYKAIWQIFQYMALLSGVILTFSSKSSVFPGKVIIFIALMPLLFWFLAIYLPMDRYGQQARKRLHKIEKEINKKTKKIKKNAVYWQIKHYQMFSRQADNDTISKLFKSSYLKNIKSLIKTLKFDFSWRVKHALWISFLIIIVFLVCILFLDFGMLIKPNAEKLELELQPVEITLPKTQIEELKNTLDTLDKKIDSIDLLIKEIKANSETRQQSTK